MTTELRVARNGAWVRRGYSPIDPVVGTTVPVGADLVAAIAAGAAGDTFVLTATPTQPYRIATTLPLKQGQTIVSSTGSVIKGSIAVSGWTSDGSGHWYVDGLLPADYADGGVCNITSGAEANPCQRREDLFVDGVQLKRWMTLTDLVSGGFYEDYLANRTYIADNPAGRTVEMSRSSQAINTTVTAGHLSGLTFQHFACASQTGAVLINGSGWQVDGCDFSYNHACGLHLSVADGAYVHDNTMHHNGQLGMVHYRSANTRIENNTFASNNFMRDYWALDWESGGFKATYSTGALVKGNYSHDNNGVGIWFDIDNSGCTIDGNTIDDNASCGIRHEISFDAVIKNNTVRRNGYGHTDSSWRNGNDGSAFATAGININCSGGGYEPTMGTIEVMNNIVQDNQNGIGLQQRNRGNSTTYPTRSRTTQNVKVHDNTITMRGRPGDQYGWGATGIGELTYTDDAVYHSRGNTFSNNIYYVDSLAALRFRGWKTGPNQMMTLSEFQANGFDSGSTVAVAPRSGFRVAASADDGYWSDVGATVFSTTSDRALIGDYDATTYGRSAWVRVAVAIPQGATITSATLDLLPKGINGSVPPMKIAAHRAANSLQPTSRSDIGSRTLTTASSSWQPASWTIGSWLSSADITAVVQEIVSDPAWVSGNYMTFIIKPQTIGWTGVQQYIAFTSYDSDAASAAGLTATWTA